MTLPPGMDEATFNELPEAERIAWTKWVDDVQWLMEQPRFRSVAIRFIDDPQFCGASTDPFDRDPLMMARKTGLAAAGRLLQMQLQHIAPRLWRRMLNEEVNARSNPGPEITNG